MGQTLSEPVVEKASDKGQDVRMLFGLSAMQGWRISMEDSHTAVLDMNADNPEVPKTDKQLSFFGVFDGHGGDKVANFAGEHIHRIVAKQEAFKAGDYDKALKDGFLATDRAILSDPKYEEEVSGCTACCSLIVGNTIYTANAGDSRGVLGIKGRAKPLSFDHKPQNDVEKSRITAAGGFVDFGRVNGNLALSRAIGDFEFKKSAELSPEAQIVTAYPDVTEHELTKDDEFLVVACDGIWDCQSSQNVIEFVRRGIAAKQDLDKICENMMDNCLASNSETGGVGCDNMTIMIIGFLQGKTKDEWYEEIAQRVANGDGPCAPPEYAEFRGPGVHHSFDDSDSGYDVDMDGTGGKGAHNTKSFGMFEQENKDSESRITDVTNEEADKGKAEQITATDDSELMNVSDDKDADSVINKSEAAAKEQSTADKIPDGPAKGAS